MRLSRFLSILFLASLLGACGGIQFKRTSGAFKYRALPVGSPVKVVAAAQDLPQPTQHIGDLSWSVQTRSQPKADDAKAVARFQAFGARYGCDAVVGEKSATTKKDITKKVKKLGPDGKYVYESVLTSRYTHIYTARCIRTAKAPGGLVAAATQGPQPTTVKAAKLNLPSTGAASTGGGSAKPTSEKTERDRHVRAIWLALSPYSSSFLKNWKSALAGPPASAHDVIAAFIELMVQVSGSTGIWRKTVPNDWFGCPANPTQEQCKKLAIANKEFSAWDGLQRSMERQSPASARGWIKRNRRRLLGYLGRYVPRSPNLTGLQQTPLYIDKVR